MLTRCASRRLTGATVTDQTVTDSVRAYRTAYHTRTSATTRKCRKKQRVIIHLGLPKVLPVVRVPQLFCPPPSRRSTHNNHVQKATRLFLERPVDRSGHCKYADLCAWPRHRAQRAIGG